MSKSRVSSLENKATRSSLEGERQRFFGLSLAGGKTDKACLIVLDSYAQQKKFFLSHLFEKIKHEEQMTSDQKIIELISQNQTGAVSLTLDVPWRLPVSLRAGASLDLSPPHQEWADKQLKKKTIRKKPQKIFQPYTQRCIELYLAYELEEKFTLGHTMGANTAPLLARAMYLTQRLQVPLLEMSSRVSMWRIGKSLKLMKSQLRSHRDPHRGEDVRRLFIQKLCDANYIFIYEQDKKSLIDNAHAFEALLCALTGFFAQRKQIESRPADFPKDEDWIAIPKSELDWKL